MVSLSKSLWYKTPTSWFTRFSSIFGKINIPNAEVPSPTVKTSFLHV